MHPSRTFFFWAALWALFTPSSAITVVEVSSCGHLLTYLPSCSETLSLVISKNIDCSLTDFPDTPIEISGQCVISGGFRSDGVHTPILNWGERESALHVSEDSAVMLENLHMRFGSVREGHFLGANAVSPVFALGARSRLMLTSVVVSFDRECFGEGFERRFGLHSRRAEGDMGTFLFGNRSAAVEESGASVVVCQLGVHCGAESESALLESFVEQVTGEDVTKVCASSHLMIDPNPKTEMKGVWVTVSLVVVIVILLILLALVRKEITDRMIRAKSPFRITSTRQILTRACTEDMSSFQVQDVQQLYDDPKAAAKDFPFSGFGDDVHVNPLYCSTDDFLGKSTGLVAEGTPMGFAKKAKEQEARSGRESAIQVPPCVLKIHEGLRAALWCQNVTLYVDSCELGKNITSALVRGSYAGEIVAVGIHEHDTETSEKFCKRAHHLSRLVHPNVVRVFFALEEDHALEDFNHENRLGCDPEDDPWGSRDDTGLIVQSALIMELCDLGPLSDASPSVLSFFCGWWNMPKLTLVLLTAMDIAEAIGFLHENGRVHGHLKAENVHLKSDNQDPRGFVCKVDNLHGGDDEAASSRGRAKDVKAFGHLMLSLLSMGEEPTHAFGVPQALLALMWSCGNETVTNQIGFNVICKDLRDMLANYKIEGSQGHVNEREDGSRAR